jgi:hypothetical protein
MTSKLSDRLAAIVRRKLLRVGHVFPPYSRQGTSSCFSLQSCHDCGSNQVPNFARRTKAALLCACTQEKWPPGPVLKLELAHELCQCPCLSHGAGPVDAAGRGLGLPVATELGPLMAWPDPGPGCRLGAHCQASCMPVQDARPMRKMHDSDPGASAASASGA